MNALTAANARKNQGTLKNTTLPTLCPGRWVVIRLEIDESFPGRLAIYGAKFGRYPLDPTLVFVTK